MPHRQPGRTTLRHIANAPDSHKSRRAPRRHAGAGTQPPRNRPRRSAVRPRTGPAPPRAGGVQGPRRAVQRRLLRNHGWSDAQRKRLRQVLGAPNEISTGEKVRRTFDPIERKTTALPEAGKRDLERASGLQAPVETRGSRFSGMPCPTRSTNPPTVDRRRISDRKVRPPQARLEGLPGSLPHRPRRGPRSNRRVLARHPRRRTGRCLHRSLARSGGRGPSRSLHSPVQAHKPAGSQSPTLGPVRRVCQGGQARRRRPM